MGNFLRIGSLLIVTAGALWLAMDRGGQTAWFVVYSLGFLWAYLGLVVWQWLGPVQVEALSGTGSCVRGERLEAGYAVRFARRPLLGTWIGLEIIWLHAVTEACLVMRDAVPAGRRREVVFRGRMTAPSRGVYAPDAVVVRAGDAFGLLRLERRLEEGAAALYVLPRPWAAAAAAAGEIGGRGDARPVEVPQVSGTRPYAPGDPLRRIHWRSSARTGDLRAKELEQPAAGRLLLVLDAAGGASSLGSAEAELKLEAAVEAAAGLAKQALELGRGVRLAVADGQGRVWEAQRRERLPELLRLLAAVPGSDDRPVGGLLLREAQQAAGGTVTLVTARADAQLPELLRRLPRGAAQVVYVHGPGAVSGAVHAWRRQLEACGCRVTLLTAPEPSPPKGAGVHAIAGA
ncbi:DUF58 domain-containing protein [Paenibacillus sp. GD4]|uniref:DUF58 domain-containing protein n=1 Tax=Paenibacillus sp. GD4 TaxID=3068890 RepID=UPI0027963F6E|nr:DUF58 domain-containing protein [Paenibacillus sp. GD4]MDQ1911609.1 DUF58 domain-containing protein [Paenibacillus sp. GD4]